MTRTYPHREGDAAWELDFNREPVHAELVL
jgi:hypothetical protein